MIKTILIVILAVAFFGLAPSGIAQTQASSKDEKAIRSLILERIESFNNKHEAPQSAAFTQMLTSSMYTGCGGEALPRSRGVKGNA